MITVAHIRQAIEIACAGGTNEHPYDQTSWGGSECGTACCVYGQAAALAGVQGVYVGPVDVEATPEAGTLARLMWTTSPDILLVMRGVQPDGSIDLHGSDLRGVDLGDCDLRGADLSGCDLRGADLSGSNLGYCVFSGAVLHGIDLSFCDLRGADLRGVDLSVCDLRGADLRDAHVLPSASTRPSGVCTACWPEA